MNNQSMMEGLRMLAVETAQQLETVQDHGKLWCAPPAGSEAAADLANRESGPSSAWGEAPVRDVMDIVWMALELADENVRAVGALLGHPQRTCYPFEVLSRAVIEAASLAFWLTEGGVDVRARVARGIVYRMNGATRMEEALDSIGGPHPGEQRRDYGELANDVKQAAADLGLTLTHPGGKWDCAGERYPGYLARASKLSASFSRTPGVPYQVYSGVAHAELWGLWRGCEQLPRNGHPHDRYQLAFTPLAVHSTIQALVGAVTAAAGRTATYLGAATVAAELAKWAGEAGQRLDVLRP